MTNEEKVAEAMRHADNLAEVAHSTKPGYATPAAQQATATMWLAAEVRAARLAATEGAGALDLANLIHGSVNQILHQVQSALGAIELSMTKGR